MSVLLTVIQWFLVVLAAAISALFVATKAIPSAIIVALAILLLLPPLQGAIENKLAFLKSRLLRIFLALVLLFVSPYPIVASMAKFELGELKLCSQPANGVCEQNLEQYATNQSVYLSAVPSEIPADLPDNAEIRVKVSYQPEPNKKISLLELKATVNGSNPILVEIPLEKAGIGSYAISLASATSDLSVIADRTEFAVWPESVDLKQLATQPTSSFQVDLVKTCLGLVQESEGLREIEREDTCQSDLDSFPEGIKAIRVHMNLSGTDDEGTTNLRTIWRYLGGNPNLDEALGTEEPTLLGEETTAIPNDIGVYVETKPWGDNKSFPFGTYDVTIFPETQNAIPVNRTIQIKKIEIVE